MLKKFDINALINNLDRHQIYCHISTEGYDYNGTRVHIYEFRNFSYKYIIALYPDNYWLTNITSINLKDATVADFVFPDDQAFFAFKTVLEDFMKSPIL